MDWGALGSKLVKHGVKVLGGALAGPPGIAAAAGSILAEELGTDPDPEAVAAELQAAGPEALPKLREIEARRQVDLARVMAERLESVNRTMRVEATSEHWPQYTWRPWVGAWWPVAVCLVYVVLPLAGADVPDVPEWIWMGWAAILGVATWDRGKLKRGLTESAPAGALGSVAGALFGKR